MGVGGPYLLVGYMWGGGVVGGLLQSRVLLLEFFGMQWVMP